MNKVQVLLLLIMISAISACQAPQKVEPKVKFEVIMNEYFNGYKPELKPSMIQPGNSIAEIIILKDLLSRSEMKNIKKKIETNGWKEVKRTQNYSFYCLNRNQAMSILYPESHIEKDNDDIPINFSNINSWSIVLYYQSFGVYSCLQR